jgi:hypothetical protein
MKSTDDKSKRKKRELGGGNGFSRAMNREISFN